jgi:hypothetical protein
MTKLIRTPISTAYNLQLFWLDSVKSVLLANGKESLFMFHDSKRRKIMNEADLNYKFPVMHSEHRCWHFENQRWKEEVQAWQRELNSAEADLKRLQEAFRERQEAVDTHLDRIDGDERALKDHEQSMHTYETGYQDVKLQSRLEKAHTQRADLHVAHRAEHEKLKKGLHKFTGRLETRIHDL